MRCRDALWPGVSTLHPEAAAAAGKYISRTDISPSPLQKGEYKVSGNSPFEGGAHRAGDVILPIALRRTGK